MSQSTRRVIEALNTPGVASGKKFRVLKCLGEGPTNETWLVTHDRERYVVRLIKPRAKVLGLSVTEELAIVTAAAGCGLAPRVVASCASRGVVLSRFVEGRIWTKDDLHDRAQLRRLAKTLRNVHKLDRSARPIDLAVTVDRYATLSTDARAGEWAKNVFDTLARISTREPVVCHNDINVTNVVDSDRLVLLDWEYAAVGDPLFDLAVVVAHHELDVPTSEFLLSSYLGHEDAGAITDLNNWRQVYRNLVALWRSGAGLEVTVDSNTNTTKPG